VETEEPNTCHPCKVTSPMPILSVKMQDSLLKRQTARRKTHLL
jgi:hypothetical protein